MGVSVAEFSQWVMFLDPKDKDRDFNFNFVWVVPAQFCGMWLFNYKGHLTRETVPPLRGLWKIHVVSYPFHNPYLFAIIVATIFWLWSKPGTYMLVSIFHVLMIKLCSQVVWLALVYVCFYVLVFPKFNGHISYWLHLTLCTSILYTKWVPILY